MGSQIPPQTAMTMPSSDHNSGVGGNGGIQTPVEPMPPSTQETQVGGDRVLVSEEKPDPKESSFVGGTKTATRLPT